MLTYIIPNIRPKTQSNNLNKIFDLIYSNYTIKQLIQWATPLSYTDFCPFIYYEKHIKSNKLMDLHPKLLIYNNYWGSNWAINLICPTCKTPHIYLHSRVFSTYNKYINNSLTINKLLLKLNNTYRITLNSMINLYLGEEIRKLLII